MKVIRANAEYTGGGIYIYTGQLDNGNYFQTSTGWEDYVQELDADPEENWDENSDEMWQNEHLVEEHCGDEAMGILRQAMKYIIDNQPTGNYAVGEIEDNLLSLENELIEGKKVKIVFEDGSFADITGEITLAEDGRIHILREEVA